MARGWHDVFLTDGELTAPLSAEAEEEQRGFFRRLRQNMRKTREALAAEVQATLFEGDLDEETWERLEQLEPDREHRAERRQYESHVTDDGVQVRA